MGTQAERRADLPKVSQPVAGRASVGTPRWQPWALSFPMAPEAPSLAGSKGAREPGRKSPHPGVAACFRPAPRRARPRVLRSADLDGRPRPAHLSRTAGRQPHPLPGPGVRPASTAPGTGCCARRGVRRPEGRRSYLKWALSSRQGRPRRPGACRRRGRSRRCSSATAAPVYTPPREDADRPVT